MNSLPLLAIDVSVVRAVDLLKEGLQALLIEGDPQPGLEVVAELLGLDRATVVVVLQHTASPTSELSKKKKLSNSESNSHAAARRKSERK